MDQGRDPAEGGDHVFREGRLKCFGRGERKRDAPVASAEVRAGQVIGWKALRIACERLRLHGPHGRCFARRPEERLQRGGIALVMLSEPPPDQQQIVPLRCVDTRRELAFFRADL